MVDKHRFVFLALLVLAALLVGCDDGSASQTPVITTAPHASVTGVATVSSTSTQAPTLTSTPPPAATTGPVVLGGDIGAFISKFGQPDRNSGYAQYHFLQCGSSTTDQLVVLTTPADGDAYSTHALEISYQACSDSVDAQVAFETCQAYLPSDAVQQRSVPQLDSTGQVSGVDVVYYSSWLAGRFPSSQFTNDQGNEVQAGLLDILYYYYIPDGSQISACDLNLGESQSQNG